MFHHRSALLLLSSLLLSSQAPAQISAPAPAMQEPATLSLAQAQRLALERNPDLRAALSAVRGAQAATRTADNAPNPVLTLQTMNINPAQGIGSGSLRAKAIDSAIRIDQQIERGGKRELRVRNAQFLEQAARADLGEVRRQLRLAVAQAYYDLLAA